MIERRHITVEGIVQGVGLRPFVYGLAVKNGLRGFVLNDTSGVTIEAEGEPPALDNFLRSLREQAPPLARVERIACEVIRPKGEVTFSIADSQVEEERRVLISPDIPTCEECLSELFDPADRRYRYPFINCTNCGPRFTIAKDVPYDRARTTMAAFTMCGDCGREYHDPANRRFHAQPNACWRCGPRVRLLDAKGREVLGDEAVSHAVRLLRHGAIIALKGLGGYHLACNAFDAAAVRRLRAGKHREDKPFAVMAQHIQAVKQLCFVSAKEEQHLRSPERPIVLLRKRDFVVIADAVAPGYRCLGVMLPYTPLHHLLLSDAGVTLVMTSGNLSEEPIAFEDEEALGRLAPIADYFLAHDREIRVRCDDSVTRVIDDQELIVRRSRGYAPQPIPMAAPFVRPVLACGAHLKNSFCLGKERYAFMSHHIGDLENYQTVNSFARGIEHFEHIFAIRPAVVAHDLHPDYLSTRYALGRRGTIKIGVQHHHAHIASCMAEHGLAGPVIGVAFDGLGYGSDGAIWGGEFLVAELAHYERRAHLRYVPLTGGDAAIRQPWRMALSYLRDALGQDPISLGLPGWEGISEKKIAVVASMAARGVNTVQTSSCGRFFDAVASILGLRHEVNYEGQAAVELEWLAAGGVEESYPYGISAVAPWEIDMRPAVKKIVREIQSRQPPASIAAKFHNTLVAAIVEVCQRLRAAEKLDAVCLSGGTFQNVYLLERLVPRLRACGFAPYRNRKVPPNDGGIALGQAVIANEIIRRGG
ncbi:MAG TPA: carbamoyltransferase HypF [Candidatus Binatia bacterium]|nr:carbamoyltransferase HypF [Candidatus Binatia bacterium]